jgi:hypothetical protein
MTDKQRNFVESIAEQLDINLPNDYFNWSSKQASENIDDYNLSKRRSY